MKIKRVICAILAVLLFSGCGLVGQPESSEPTSTESQSSVLPSAPEWGFTPGTLTYYVNFPQSEHWTLSTYMGSGVQTIVLSNENLDSLMSSPIDHNSSFSSHVGIALRSFDDMEAMQYPLYLYQTYRGMDWGQMAQLKQEAEDGNADALSRLQEYEQMFAEDFAALAAEDIPQFYTYRLVLQTAFSDGRKAKRYHSMELIFGSDTITVPLGILDINNLPLWDGLPEAEELIQKEQEAVQVSYWTDFAELPAVQIAATAQPQVLTGIAYLGGEVTFSDICLSWTADGQTITQQWDGTTPITIPADTQASLSAILHHNGKSVMGYCAGGYLTISREYEGKNQRLWYSLPLTQHWNVYELYAMVVDGIDLAPYYAYAHDYTPAESEHETPGWEQTFDQMLFSQDGFSVTAVSARADDFAYTLTLLFENGNEESVEVFFEKLYINGYLYQQYPSCKVSGSGRTEMEVSFPWEELDVCGITEKSLEAVFLLEMNLTVKTENGQYVVKREPLLPLYAQGAEMDPTPVVTPEMTLLLDTELFALWVVRDWVSQDNLVNQYRSRILFVNKSDQVLYFNITGATINGETKHAGYACLAEAGRFVIDEYTVFSPSDHRWATVEEITVSFSVEAADFSWKEDYTATYYPNIPLS